MNTAIPVRRTRPRLSPVASLQAAARGLAFFGLMLAGLGLLVVILVAPGLLALGFSNVTPAHHGDHRVVLALLVIGAGLGIARFLVPGALLAIRRLASLTRRLAGEWCGVPIAESYLPLPGPGDRPLSFTGRLSWLLKDPATWRDLLWVTVNVLVGWVVAAAGAAIMVVGLVEFIGTNFIRAIPPPAFPGNSAGTLGFLGVAIISAGLLAAPWLLHDGAQARLVAMGMTLDAAGQIIDTNPVAARALLYEARDASVKALAELRDLVRGIHPPVLADRGLADAIRALALDSPLRIELAGELAGRPPAPVESAAYFAVCELLANVSKHAEARQTWIDIRQTDGMLRIGVTDNGRGGADPARGSGLSGIERRLAPFDGILAVSSPLGGPTAVTMEIPCALSSPKTSSC